MITCLLAWLAMATTLPVVESPPIHWYESDTLCRSGARACVRVASLDMVLPRRPEPLIVAHELVHWHYLMNGDELMNRGWDRAEARAAAAAEEPAWRLAFLAVNNSGCMES